MTDRSTLNRTMMSKESHEASGEGARDHAEVSHGMRAAGRPLPLNSKRLTSVYVQTIARAMDLPTKGSVAETRQMIEGRLSDVGREPTNVQVMISDDHDGAEFVSLVDASGTFLGPEPVLCPRDEVSGGGGVETHGGSDGEESVHEGRVAELEEALASCRKSNEELEDKVSELSGELKRVRGRVDEMWRMNCAQVVAFDETITEKDSEIELLTSRIAELEASLTRASEVVPDRSVPTPRASGARLPPTLPSALRTTVLPRDRPPAMGLPEHSGAPRRGKAPPVREFTGEDLECQLDDWLPSLERASVWNAWTAEERLMQLAGHLRGRALQEYNLLQPEERESFESTVEVLRSRLEPGSKAVAAQDFRHAVQKETESVSDFVRRLERTFRVAYGRDPMSSETRDTLLYCQLQEGLRYELMKGPAVSGATKYQELCVAAKNEEKRLAELRRRQQYSKGTQPRQSQAEHVQHTRTTPTNSQRIPSTLNRSTGAEPKKCFLCKKPGHLMRDCRLRKAESAAPSRPATTKQVTVNGSPEGEAERPNPYDLLYSSDSEDEGVRQIRVTDEGRRQ